MYILGLNAFHGDSAACIYRDGVLIAASEEERFRRIKHWAGLPTEAIRFCLDVAGIDIRDVDHIAISRDPKANAFKKIKHLLTKGFRWSLLYDRLRNRGKVNSVKQQLAAAFNLDESSLKATIHQVEHHRSHLASTFFVSPFEEAALLSIDGFGDFTSTMTGIGRGNHIEISEEVNYPHSIGVFYTAFTQWLGFPHYGDEYKVMGLAPYGQPLYTDKIRQVIRVRDNGLFDLDERYFLHVKNGVAMTWEAGIPEIGSLFSLFLVEQFGPARTREEPLTDYHRDIAASVQRVCEEVIFHLLEALHRRTGLDAVCIAGGVAQNSVANGKIINRTSFKRLYIPPAGHDAGTATGAALFVLHQILGFPCNHEPQSAYTGSRFTNDQIKSCLHQRGIGFTSLETTELVDLVSDCLVDGGVVGWFQGAAEFGPRALGNRSILADPRRTDAKDLLNAKIKRRESFRPFAPSILQEYVADYFEVLDEVPYMEKVFPIRKDKQSVIPAVTHVDGTGRLQTVSMQTNPKYYQLIQAFYRKTGVPILLNTSFNENEPIVNTPEEALECFLRTKMDMLVLENCVIRRS
jgi:carbamoyltransferase